MRSTTIRVDRETRALLVELSEASGESLIDTVREAVDCLRRRRFAEQAATDIAALQADSAAWTDYLAEAESTHVTDGLD